MTPGENGANSLDFNAGFSCPISLEVETMAKRGRKKRDRKHSKANHGNRPNA